MKIRPILIFSHIFFENSLQFQKLYLPLQPQTRKIGAIAQLVEQRTENPCVPGIFCFPQARKKRQNITVRGGAKGGEVKMLLLLGVCKVLYSNI